MSISLLFLWFMIFSLFGWIYECIFCTIKNGHWENRGFLFGPICPIYGVGAVSVITLFGLLFRTDEPLPLWEVFLISMIGSAILEYATSFLLEKIFHAIWWDYSNIPLNINGRICLPASLGFGVLGVLIYRFVLPVVMRLSGHIPDIQGVIKECKNFEPRIMLKVFLRGLLEYQRPLFKTPSGAQASSCVVKAVQDCWNNVSVFNQSVQSALEVLVKELAKVNKMYGNVLLCVIM